jgi:hypothetical protein
MTLGSKKASGLETVFRWYRHGAYPDDLPGLLQRPPQRGRSRNTFIQASLVGEA